MEHPGSPLPAPTRLRRLPAARVAQHGDFHHVSYQCVRARARHGLHYEEIKGIRVFGADDAAAHRDAAEDQVCAGEEIVKRGYPSCWDGVLF